MSVLVYDCGSVENTVTAILDTESGAMIIRGNGDIDNYADESSPWYSEHSDILQVTVDKGITRIGSGTFYGCENLSFIEIANTVTTIGADVFQNCTSLTTIKIPKSITAIGNGTFADSGLTEVKFYGNPPTVGTDIFDGVTADVYTPEGNEEWTETAKGTVAGNGSNLTWKTFDSKPNLIEYDELDYLWSKIKKYVDNNVSVTQVVTSGTKIATIRVNGVDTDLYTYGLSGTVGDSTTPVYLNDGVITACGSSLAVDITGTANTAINSTFATSAALAIKANKLGNDTIGGTATPIYLNSGVPVACGDNLNVNITGHFTDIIGGRNLLRNTGHTAGGNTTTDGTTITVGTEVRDTYFYLYNAVALKANKIYTISFDVTDLETDKYIKFRIGGTNNSNFEINVNKNGRIYATGFFTSNVNAGAKFILDDIEKNLPSTSFTLTNFKLEEGEQATAYSNAWEDTIPNATNATKVVQKVTTLNGNRPLLCAYITGTTTTSDITDSVLYTNTVYVNPSTGVLTATGFSGPLTGNVTGNAATATTATNANNAKLTHTVNDNEYPLVFGSSFIITDAQQALRIGTPSATRNQCPLRVKAYCAAANTQGESSIVIGNALAKASANNSRGGLYLYGTGTTWAKFQVGDQTADKTVTLVAPADVTLTMPSATGTLALTSSNITGSSASCTGNAATATSATTATNANNAKLTPTNSNTWYPVVFGSSHVTSASNQALRIASGSTTAAQTMFNFDPSVNPSAVPSSATKCYLQLGNGIAYNNSTNYAIARQGVIRLYGNNTSHTDIVTAATTTARTITLPDATGTVALTSSDITGNAATATSAGTCTGNSATATLATGSTNIRVIDTDSNTWYPLVFSSGTAANTNYAARVDADSILVYPGTSPAANTQGNCYLQLGNAKAKATAGNKRGVLRIFGTGTSYTEITSAVGATARSISFPDKAGTVALTSDIPTVITPGDYITETWWAPNYSTTTSNSNTDDSKSTFWYIKFNSGLLIQGCRGFSTSTGSSSLTWKIAFTKAPYLYAGVNTRKTTSGGDSWDYIYSMSTTSMTVLHEAGNGFYCIAVGQWK